MSHPRHWSGMTGAEFRSELKRLNLTQQWFAEQCGFDLSAVVKWGQHGVVATGVPVPQHVAFILQLLDRLAYRGEMHEIESQIEAFIRMITSQTLQPRRVERDASRIRLVDGLETEPLRAVKKKRSPQRELTPAYRVIWENADGEVTERWYSHRPGAYRKRGELRKSGIVDVRVEHSWRSAA